MKNRSIAAPAEGLRYFGPKPVSVEVREVPPQVSDADLTAFFNALAASRRGLMLGSGEGFGGTLYSVHWKTLLARAKEYGIEAPVVPAPPRPQGRRYFVNGVETNENGQPLPPQAGA